MYSLKPSRLINHLKRAGRLLRKSLDQVAIIYCERTRIVTPLYYTLVSHSFLREQRAVLSGKSRFNTGMHAVTGSSSFLRRNIHRLEKGIISRPRRKVFADDYIEDTVAVYKHFSELNGSDSEIAWANDVLKEYFSLVDDTPRIKKARLQFLKMAEPKCPEPDRFSRRIPYVRDLNHRPVEYEEFLSLAKQRRSVRWFAQSSVPRDLIIKAMNVATQAPSACNRQPFEFRVFDDPELLSDISRLPAGTAGFEHNFPCVIVIVGQQRYYFDERDRHLIYIDGSLAAMSFILALETLGLSSCCINWPDIDERETKAQELLQLEADERPVMFIAVGYPDPEGLVPYSEKRSAEQLCRFNFE